ncbi:MAG: glucose-6-phosphate dehydrogenase [Sphingomonadales bacterium]
MQQDIGQHGFDLVIFGGTGDLSSKKLIPALFSGWQMGHLPRGSRLFLTTRKKPAAPALAWLKGILAAHPPRRPVEAGALEAFAARLQIVELELTEGGDNWRTLADQLLAEPGRVIIHFLAIPPTLFTSVYELLARFGLNGDSSRIIVEKPLGHDLASAIRINDKLAAYFSEAQTFRIDHYLGKEAVQNLLALRFSNILFETLWDNRTIDHIQITIAEDIGLKGRGGFYDHVGALRDMVQNHLLQLLCLLAMEPPARMDADSIREEKLKVLKALAPMTGERVKTDLVRAQYTAGTIKTEIADSYQQDMALETPSQTESFVAIKTYIENWRWAGVPFYLRTGKRLPDRFAEIVIQFKPVPHAAAPDWGRQIQPNRFIIRLQPEDHLALRVMAKNQSPNSDDLKEVELDLDFSGEQRLGPYLRLILAASQGDQSLFVHRQEVELAWQWIDTIVAHWQEQDSELLPYPAGTWGPYEAHDLIRRDGRKWFHEPR